MIGHMAIAMAIAHQRQDHERRNRHWMAIARGQRAERRIRRWIGHRVVRLGERLAAPLAESAA